MAGTLNWKEVRPVLEATYDLLDEMDHVDGADVCEALGWDREDESTLRMSTRPLLALRAAGLIEAEVAFGPSVGLIRPTAEGLQTVRGWPRPGEPGPEGVELLLALLDDRIAAATSDEERSRWERLRDATGRMSQSVLAEVLGAWMARMSGAG